MVLIGMAVTVLAALGDTAINGSVTFVTWAGCGVVSVVCAAMVK